jgi:hypothetical protein
MSRTNRW